ncbi:hypothetical protein ACFWAY_51655 [Rhodococcus sp. NPDC059968]|uniref:hypothetical protein n=1 Tax=Rhodococcus sp. NPDC059968 TaxID=3347017 RepID=UPI00367274E5
MSAVEAAGAAAVSIGGAHVFADTSIDRTATAIARGDRPGLSRRGRMGPGAASAVVRAGASAAGPVRLPGRGLFHNRADSRVDLRPVPSPAGRTRAR